MIIIIIFLMSELNNALNGLITCYKKKPTFAVTPRNATLHY